jgi:hypothetical protein
MTPATFFHESDPGLLGDNRAYPRLIVSCALHFLAKLPILVEASTRTKSPEFENGLRDKRPASTCKVPAILVGVTTRPLNHSRRN